MTLVDHSITLICFCEGVWDQRPKYLTELPKGKTVGWLHGSDIFEV